MEPPIPPGRVIPGQPQHQRADLRRHCRPRWCGRSSGVGPGPDANPAASPAGRTSPARPDGAAAAPAQPAPPGRPSRPAAGSPGVPAPPPRGATRAARRVLPPHSSPAAQATAAPGRTADRAVEEPGADHRGPATPVANSQLSNHDRPSGTHTVVWPNLFAFTAQPLFEAGRVDHLPPAVRGYIVTKAIGIEPLQQPPQVVRNGSVVGSRDKDVAMASPHAAEQLNHPLAAGIQS
jgi:hypothetical protein